MSTLTTEQEQHRQQLEREAERLREAVAEGDPGEIRAQAQQVSYVLSDFLFVADGGEAGE